LTARHILSEPPQIKVPQRRACLKILAVINADSDIAMYLGFSAFECQIRPLADS
jgi:hypothetical protein